MSSSEKNGDVKTKWIREQERIRESIVTQDTESWQQTRTERTEPTSQEEVASDNESALTYVAGVDLSFSKNETTACAAIVVCKLPNLEVVYEDFTMHEVTVPYVAGFLSFREVEPLIAAVNKLRVVSPSTVPQVILVDGNGILHYREAGLACHLGVETNIPTIGVAKNLLMVDDIVKDDYHKHQIQVMEKAGSSFPLLTKSGKVLGKALKTCEAAQNPVYVSVGHRISLETAVWVTSICSKHRIPEPIRQADIRSREFLREKF